MLDDLEIPIEVRELLVVHLLSQTIAAELEVFILCAVGEGRERDDGVGVSRGEVLEWEELLVVIIYVEVGEFVVFGGICEGVYVS